MKVESMNKTYHIHEKNQGVYGWELYEYNSQTDIVKNQALEIIPTIVFLNKIQYFVNECGFEITVFGEGDSEYGMTFECKVRQDFNTTIYEAPETSNRTNGILNCFEWLITNKNILP